MRSCRNPCINVDPAPPVADPEVARRRGAGFELLLEATMEGGFMWWGWPGGG